MTVWALFHGMKTNKSIICAEKTMKCSLNLKDQISKIKQYFEPDSALTDPDVPVITIKQSKKNKKSEVPLHIS